MQGRLVIEVPPLPVVELLLVIISLLLARSIWLLSEGRALLSKAAEGGLAKLTESKSSDERPHTHALTRGRSASAVSESRTPREPKFTDRVLQTSAKMFEQSMLDEADVDVGKFMDACRWYADKVLMRMGTFTLVTVRETHTNMDKVKQNYELNPDKHRSMRNLLEAECWSDMHQPGGVLMDPSAAMGLLWARRVLMFWICLFRRHMDRSDMRPATPTKESPAQSEVITAYEEALAPFNGWVTRTTFMLASRAFPEWQDIEAVLASNHEDAMADLRSWVQVLEPLLERMDNIIQDLDLNDMRKSI
ncbi:hypothetical protein AB1Y20_021311 [Prymnesium parvum]|uniref:Glycolipid transfer protein domain-containing protein n=1 Tax=Prymnesium parvum TaxID=97485 RepID=A0AB34JIC7_PRYPA